MKSLAVRYAGVLLASVGVWAAVGLGYDPMVVVALLAIASTALALAAAVTLSPAGFITSTAGRRMGIERRDPALGGHGIVAAPRRPRGP